MPGFSEQRPMVIPRWGFTLKEVSQMLRDTIVNYAGDGKVVLVVHDWGSYFGFVYCEEYPESVDKFVTLDIGLSTPKDLTLKEKLVDLSYKGLLALAFVFRAVGLPTFGALMVGLYPWSLLGPCPKETAVPPRTKRYFSEAKDGFDVAMCYPYAQLFRGLFNGSLKRPQHPLMPTLFLYGTKKRMMFHSSAFLRTLESKNDGSKHKALTCGHFIQAQQPQEAIHGIKQFLQQ